MFKLFTRRDEGFTLVELLIVIAIIGVLAAIAIPVFLSQVDKADRAAMQSDANSIAKLVVAQLAANDIAGTSLQDADTVTHGEIPTSAYWTLLMDSAPYTRTWNGGTLGTITLSDPVVQGLVRVSQQTTNPGGYCVYTSTTWSANFDDNGSGAITAGNTDNVTAVGNDCLTVPAP